MTTEQLPDGLQLAVNIISEAEWPEGAGGNPLDAVLNEHAQRLTLQHLCADQVWRIADLEVKCVTLKELHDAATDERDELRAKYDELLVALHGIGKALGIPESDRSPYSVMCGTLERVNALAEIEAQEPVALVETSGDQGAGIGWSRAAQPVGAKLYAHPVPAQAVPGGWRLMAWAHEDGRVIPVTMMDNAKRDGGATFSSVKAYTIALYAAPEHKA